MEESEKLIALEHIIYRFADNQFKANGVSPAEAAIIMEAISGKMQRQCLEAVIMGMVSTSDMDQTEVEGEEGGQECIEDT